jgi:DNA (cytosine-5)-methyltransferase 1
MFRVLDLFSGIGGFSLGLECTGGFKTVAFCEIEPFPRKVLSKHWPEVPIYDDVRTLTANRLAADGIAVDVICGGFPCQDISLAGKGAGLEGERSGLWSEIARLAGELRPRFVIVENVSALLGRGLDRVLGDLAAIGFDAEWHCIPASSIGAPHRRDRLWLVAHAPNHGLGWGQQFAKSSESPWDVADAEGERQQEGRELQSVRATERVGWGSLAVADANFPRLAVGESIPSNDGKERPAALGDGWWLSEPDVGRVAHGVSYRVDRLKGLGNAVVPQIPYLIGLSILAAERQS